MKGRPMKILLAILTTGLVAVLFFLSYCLDDWLGLLAFKYQYLAICLIVSAALASFWLTTSRKLSAVVGLTIFLLFLLPYALHTPTSRILRSILNEVLIGASEYDVVSAVEAAYRDSDYVMPRIKRSANRIYVSRNTDGTGDCTAAVFYLKNGQVIRSEFSED